LGGDITSPVKIFWDPEGREVDALGTKKFVSVTDGDTPYITMSIRMLSIDTAEVHYPANQKPSRQDENLAQLARWIGERDGKVPIKRELGDYLVPKLATGKAGTLQEEQGNRATAEFEKLLNEKLTKPDGKKRSLFIYAADEHFEEYGRLLAYLSPYYTPAEVETMTRKDRATFNLLMVESGWAASFPIYPSIPRVTDLILLQEAAKNALENRIGIWADPLTLTGYEFRMCVKLYDIAKKLQAGKKLTSAQKKAWISRYCVDMTTREAFFPQDYYKVKPYNRIFVWPDDMPEAVAKMNLLPEGAG